MEERTLKNFLIMHTTLLCNQNCEFCSHPNQNINNNFETVKKIITEYKEKIGEIVFSGGEPTLNPNLIDYVNYSNKNGFRTRIITNGMNLSNKDYCQKLKDSKLDHITVSLQSSDRTIHESLTGTKGGFEKTISSIKNLISLGMIPSIMITINKKNYKSLKDTAVFLHENFPEIKSIILIILDSVGRAEKNNNVLVKFSEMEKYLHAAFEFLDKKDYILDIDGVPFCYLTDYIKYSTEFNQTKNECSYYIYALENKKVVGGPFKDKVKKFYKKEKVCLICKHYDKCPGINKNHINFFGNKEIYPIF